MATYTMELYKAIEYSDGDIGLNSYPIWDENYREHLNRKIVDHYHNREIGLETVDMFKFAMKRRMNEVMSFYNDLYKTTQLEYDPLSTVDMRTITSGTTNSKAETESESASTSKNTSQSRAVNSAFPQNALAGNGDYATSAADTNSLSEAEGTGSDKANSTTEDQSNAESRVTGYQGIPSDMVMRYRDTILNIDLMIIGELEDLFMSVWGNSDSYTPYPFTPLY